MNIIITGATKGIGRAVAILFAEKGFNICACARTASDLENLKTELMNINPSIQINIMTCDVSKKNEVFEFATFCINHLKTIDILINNAGIFLPGNIYDEPESTLETLIETNLYSAYHLTRKIVPEMIKEKRGHIFNLCSVASINAYDQGGSYAISKFGLLGFSKNLRYELMEHKIRVTAIVAGAVLTESWAGTTLPESRFIPSEDIAKLIFSAWDTSESTVVEEILIRPMDGDI
ncbi:MAG: SDR family oxidoreductase [Chitinophagales bacterium]